MKRTPAFETAWQGFTPGPWQQAIEVRDFIQRQVTPYEGDESFLVGPTPRTQALNLKFQELLRQEAKLGGVLDVNVNVVSSLLTYEPGYLDRENELIVGLQTEKPLCRGVNPFGGLRLARQACAAYGYTLGEEVERACAYRTTHNDGVFHVYNATMLLLRKHGYITGLPDAYGRGRIIGDYRRVALYGVDALIAAKQADKDALAATTMTEETIRRCEELWKEIDFLQKLKEMAAAYGLDISTPARTAQEAMQWLYFAYLGAIKEQNGAAMSLGRVSSFIDIYMERDLRSGLIDEAKAQEIVDHFVMKLRMARQLRTPEYNDLFAGDPMWITEVLGGMGEDGRTLVTRTSYRFLNTLYTLGHAPEPNLTILWSKHLPAPFRRYCSKVSIETDSIQYENDDLMRPRYGDDYGIACCVSAMKIGKQMQYFGARCNLPKVLLLAINGGRDETSGVQIAPERPLLTGAALNYEQVKEQFEFYCEWLCEHYVNTMNIIHFMHDKYAYEKLEMGLHDTQVERFMAFGLAGLSVMADSFSAIRYARVTPVKDACGLAVDFKIDGDFPCYGNDDERVDGMAKGLVTFFEQGLKKHPTYRDSIHTLSILTITSNVVYGRATGATPDGRAAGKPFAPGANPMHNRDGRGALASLNSVAGISYDSCRDGISCTFTITPESLGRAQAQQVDNLTQILDGYFAQAGHHLNINVLNRKQLLEAQAHPERFPQLTIRVSGYAVNFTRLSRKQQDEVIARTFHTGL
jgi:formate C-acetyltransferase